MIAALFIAFISRDPTWLPYAPLRMRFVPRKASVGFAAIDSESRLAPSLSAAADGLTLSPADRLTLCAHSRVFFSAVGLREAAVADRRGGYVLPSVHATFTRRTVSSESIER